MRRGFTLTEMLTVIAIMAILMALLFPVFSTSREKARQNACLTNLKQVGTALTAYAQDYDDVNVLSHDCLLSAVLSAQVGSPVLVLYAHLLLPYTRSSIVYACGSHPQVPAIPPTPFNDPTLGLNVPSLQVSYAINANNDDAILMNCTIQPSQRKVGFAGISRVRIPQPENRLALIEAPTENNPTLTPPNGWRLFYDPRKHDPNFDPNCDDPLTTCLPCWLQGLPNDCWTKQPPTPPTSGQRHTGGANYLFADGSAKWVSLLQVQQNWVAQ
jgi:prepilin-type N-terminal cleavage/methylation domain-containing protein/prepilin-type processing-associated H-X9-DG protein